MAKKIKKNTKVEEKVDTEVKTTTRGAKSVKKVVEKDIAKLKQADGKIYNKYNVKSIDELLGETNRKYLTKDVKEYESWLRARNTSDLQKHAIEVQVLPKEDRELLIRTLIKQFHVNHSAESNTVSRIDQKPVSQEVLDILAEGR